MNYIFVGKFGKLFDIDKYKLCDIDFNNYIINIKFLNNNITITENELICNGTIINKITHKYFPYYNHVINKKIKKIYELDNNLGYFIIYYDNYVLFEKYYPFYVNIKYKLSVYGKIILI